MSLSRAQRDAISLTGLVETPHVAAELMDCWTPGHLRDVALALAAAVDVDKPVSSLFTASPPRIRRIHGTGAGPHRCDRPECETLNRAWERDYRRAKRAAARQEAS